MRYFKITNLVQPSGICDYKGLEIDAFVAGSQVYSQDGKTCIISTVQDTEIAAHQDVLELTEIEYLAEKEAMVIPVPNPIEEQIAELQAQNAQMLLALVEGGLL